MENLLQLIWVFFKIGLFSIGGGYAILPLIQRQVVESNGWISQQTFTDIITISQMTPGPLAVNASTFVGIQVSGIAGGLLATSACIISGILICVCLYRFFKKHRHSIYISEILRSLKASSLGLIVSAAATILLLAFTGSSSFDSLSLDWIAITLFAIIFFVMRKWKINPILLMTIAGIIGAFVY